MTTTIPALLRERAREYPMHAALHCPDNGPIGFSALDDLCDQVARALIADGMAVGERAAVWAPNMIEWVAAAIGIQRAGGILVPLNTRLKGAEVADILRRARVTRLFCVGEFLGKYYPALLDGLDRGAVRQTIALGTARPDRPDSEYGWSDFLRQSALCDDNRLAAREALVMPDTLSDIMFTSGTTGAPKGAVFDHARSLRGGQAWVNIARQTHADRYCVFGPFSHNASYKAGWLAGLISASTVYWPRNYEPETILDLVSDHAITVMPAPPTVFQEILAHPNWRDWDLSSYRFLSTGATVVPIELMKRLDRETDIAEISTGYGMTECAGSATHTRPGDPMERVAYTVGAAIGGTGIRVIDADGNDVPTGETGEVLIRDDKLMIEYLDNPAATREAFTKDGWLHSGDIGCLDADGYLRLTDRLKDMYIVGGFNVYPAEIEKQMSGVAGIYQAAIIGVPDDRLGEIGHAFIVRAQGSEITEEDVIAWSRANLATYKVPRRVTFLDTLPLNATGKVMKPVLREMLR